MNKQQAKQYRKPSWKERCRQIIELDGGTCQVCGRKEPDVVLQVHHKKYIQGKKPWEYNQQDLITLCKGCHAREHNILSDAIPQSGWKYEGVDDLGGVNGVCELCGTELRYEHYLFHPDYDGYLSVGCDCACKLTNSEYPSIAERDLQLEEERLQRFVDSPRWKHRKNCYIYENFEKYKIMIVEMPYGCYVNLFYKYYVQLEYGGFHEQEHKISGKKKFLSLEDAKRHIYKNITDGTVLSYLCKHQLPEPEGRIYNSEE